MRNIIGALVILFLLYSCKKERQCNCSVVTSGTKTTRYQAPANTVTLSLQLPIPFPIPPLEISPAKDQTSTTSYNNVETENITYEKIKKGAMKKVCQTKFKETVNESETDEVAGTYTITTKKVGIKEYSCEIK